MTPARGYVYILLATMFWGVSATLAKVLFLQHVDTLSLVQTRTTFSCLAAFVLLLAFRPKVLKIRFRDAYKFALLGILGVAGSNYTYYLAIERTNVATAILLQYLAPLLVLLYAALAKEERITPLRIGAAVLSLFGCFLAIGGTDVSIIRLDRVGVMAGLGSALCWGFTTIWLTHMLKEYATWTALFYAFLFAALFWLVLNPPWALAHYSPQMWGTFFGFAMISVLIPHSFYFAGVQHLTASKAIIAATSEPILAIGSAALILGETLSPVQAAGAACVILAIASLHWKTESALEAQP
jgi:drug/metabolite transporter (DMT)-like permease